MAPADAQAAASSVFRLFISRSRPNSRLAPQEDRLGTIDLHFGRAIVPNGSGLFRNGLLLKSSRFEIRCILLSDLAQEGG